MHLILWIFAQRQQVTTKELPRKAGSRKLRYVDTGITGSQAHSITNDSKFKTIKLYELESESAIIVIF